MSEGRRIVGFKRADPKKGPLATFKEIADELARTGEISRTVRVVVKPVYEGDPEEIHAATNGAAP